MASLAEIRARIAAQENKSKGNSSSAQFDNVTYPHWNINENETVVSRFLPDGNKKNEFFWVERQVIKLPFNGVKGDPNVKRIEVQVPCVEMYNDGSVCPVLAEVRPWYKDKSLEEMANRYWKKRSYIFQGFVRSSPLKEDNIPENPIRKFIISPQIIPIIRTGLMDPEMIELPTDYQRGLDFNIRKTSKGNYADYSTSNWARRESALTEQEQEAISKYGLFDLASFLPKKPTEAELKIIKEMFEASVEGEPYDNERWGNYYRPYGLAAPTNAKPNESNDSDNDEPISTNVATSAPWEDEEPQSASQPVQVPKSNSGSNAKANEILEMIRNRNAQK